MARVVAGRVVAGRAEERDRRQEAGQEGQEAAISRAVGGRGHGTNRTDPDKTGTHKPRHQCCYQHHTHHHQRCDCCPHLHQKPHTLTHSVTLSRHMHTQPLYTHTRTPATHLSQAVQHAGRHRRRVCAQQVLLSFRHLPVVPVADAAKAAVLRGGWWGWVVSGVLRAGETADGGGM